MRKFPTVLGLVMFTQHSFASVPLPVELGGAALPLDMGGMAAIAAVSLILGAQLIKRKK